MLLLAISAQHVNSQKEMKRFTVIYSACLNPKTSGHVNAHLTPCPGIYFNAFIHVYSPKAGADNTLGTNVDVDRKPLSLCPFVANFKTISLKSDFIHVCSCLSTCI